MVLMFGTYFRGNYMINFYNCDDYQYIKLLNFFLTRCDIVAFCLPNFGTKFQIKYSSNYIDEYELIFNSLDRNSKIFSDYKNEVQPFLNLLKEDTLKVYQNIHYFDQTSNYEKEIYILNYNKKIYEIFKSVKRFDNWRYPKLPEDLYFFSGNKCYFSFVSHEGEYGIYDNSVETIKFMEQIGLNFYVDSYDTPPELTIPEDNQGRPIGGRFYD